ncbi:hypothetical protein FJTKL_02902 [Diaporthe vaccinii]|uniref:Uncharacterized protein n=1 Tax=Diaporthe vaccinii TaxID=105482 RepID=A0ABR4F314_9PEZI
MAALQVVPSTNNQPLDIDDNQSKCRATSLSARSRSSPRRRSRTVPFPSGFASERTIPSATTRSGGTGARLVSASRCITPQRDCLLLLFFPIN